MENNNCEYYWKQRNKLQLNDRDEYGLSTKIRHELNANENELRTKAKRNIITS